MKGQVERTNGYLETSFLPLRSFADLEDLQSQSDRWAVDVAYPRFHRRVGGRVGDAWAAERRYLHALPDPLPDVDQRTEVRGQKDGFVRVGSVERRSDIRAQCGLVLLGAQGTKKWHNGPAPPNQTDTRRLQMGA